LLTARAFHFGYFGFVDALIFVFDEFNSVHS